MTPHKLRSHGQNIERCQTWYRRRNLQCYFNQSSNGNGLNDIIVVTSSIKILLIVNIVII
jgi:hypothetical protein